MPETNFVYTPVYLTKVEVGMAFKIATYDEIEPEEATLIDQVCFGVPTTPDRVQQVRQLDKRSSDYYGVYALDDTGRAVSQVVVLHIDTQTREGRERVAGIAAVGTLPGHLRRGMSTELMEKANELSQERGIRISFLLTSSSLVAHEMYVKLGYKTLATFDRGYKQLSGRPRKHHGVQLRRFKITDAPKLDRLFSLQTEDRLGFIHRPDGFIAMKVRTHQVMPEKIKVAIWRNKTVGYLRIESEADFVSTEELVGLDDETRHDILEQVENLPSARWAFCYALCDARISQVYQSRGYNVHKPGFGRVMATCLDSSLSGDEISSLYDVDDDRFVIYPFDTF